MMRFIFPILFSALLISCVTTQSPTSEKPIVSETPEIIISQKLNSEPLQIQLMALKPKKEIQLLKDILAKNNPSTYISNLNEQSFLMKINNLQTYDLLFANLKQQGSLQITQTKKWDQQTIQIQISKLNSALLSKQNKRHLKSELIFQPRENISDPELQKFKQEVWPKEKFTDQELGRSIIGMSQYGDVFFHPVQNSKQIEIKIDDSKVAN